VFEIVKNKAGTWLLVLMEQNDQYLCVFPDGVKRLLSMDQLDEDSWEDGSDTDSRMTKDQKDIWLDFQDQDIVIKRAA
tara:strand:+ start:54208 stop:54441 length:234 start_codon:yes stop_codon:yes gene_type:complete